MPMNALLIVVLVGAAGFAVGSFVSVVAHRFPADLAAVRAGRCPHCGAAVAPWHHVPVAAWIVLGGRCRTCGKRISSRYPLFETLTGVAFAVVSGFFLRDLGADRWASSPWAQALVLIAFLYFASISIALAVIDLDTRRLPNAIVLPSYAVAAALFAAAALLSQDWAALLRAGAGMAAIFSFYLLLRLIGPGGMGGGDVKLAGVVGIYLGWIGWSALAVGAFSAFVYGGVFGLFLLVARRAGRRSALPFGPWMIAGAWTGIFAGEAIANGYLGLPAGG